jgi:hypothetical protein
MKYFDEERGAELKRAFDAVVSDWPEVTEKTMFGCPSYRAGEAVFAVLVTDGVALTRLPGDRRERLDGSFETRPFRAGDRTVTKWVQVTADADDLDSLVPYVEASYETALDGSDA